MDERSRTMSSSLSNIRLWVLEILSGYPFYGFGRGLICFGLVSLFITNLCENTRSRMWHIVRTLSQKITKTFLFVSRDRDLSWVLNVRRYDWWILFHSLRWIRVTVNKLLFYVTLKEWLNFTSSFIKGRSLILNKS